jgi:lactoylglutathione lyase
MFRSSFPILSTPDLGQALSLYRDLLGGAVSYRFQSDGEPVYVGLDIGSTHLGLAYEAETRAGPGGQRISLWVYADDCDAAVDRLRDSGVHMLEESTDQPLGRAGRSGARSRRERGPGWVAAVTAGGVTKPAPFRLLCR